MVLGTKFKKRHFRLKLLFSLFEKSWLSYISLTMNVPMKHSGFLSQNKNVIFLESFQKFQKLLFNVKIENLSTEDSRYPGTKIRAKNYTISCGIYLEMSGTSSWYFLNECFKSKYGGKTQLGNLLPSGVNCHLGWTVFERK